MEKNQISKQLKSKIMYLQLAEGTEQDYPEEINPYIFIPDTTGQKKGIYVREDYFDGMNAVDFNQMMRELSPWQKQVQQGMSESAFLADRASRKAKREQKDADKAKKRDLANQKKQAKVAIKQARADAKGGKGARGGKILDSISGILSNVMGGGKELTDVPPAGAPPEAPEVEDTPWYAKPSGMLGIGLGLVTVGGIVYVATRPKN